MSYNLGFVFIYNLKNISYIYIYIYIYIYNSVTGKGFLTKKKTWDSTEFQKIIFLNMFLHDSK